MSDAKPITTTAWQQLIQAIVMLIFPIGQGMMMIDYDDKIAGYYSWMIVGTLMLGAVIINSLRILWAAR